MKTLTSILLLLVSIQEIKAQKNTVRKDYLFENPVTKEQIRIETGNKVTIGFKIQEVKLKGTILSLSDSSLTIGFNEEPYQQAVPYGNIGTIDLIPERHKRYIVRITLNSEEILKGELIRATRDSLTVQKKIRNLPPTRVAASEIKSIRIRGKIAVWTGLSIGASTGIVVGGIAGYATYSPTSYCSSNPSSPFCFNELGQGVNTFVGAVIGGLTGSLLGLAIGTANREFIVEGNQAQFDLFANEFKEKVLFEKSK